MKPNRKKLFAFALLVAAAGLCGVLYFARDAVARTNAPEANSATEGGAMSASGAPTVPVGRVERLDLVQTVLIPAEFRPFMEVELHAKVSGYLEKMYVDFGDRVKAGQLLATIEVPELQDQLSNAIAVEQRAEADYTNAHLIFTRLQTVNNEHANLVAQQDIDNATAKDLTARAAIAAAKADVGRFRTLLGYTRITAPFDGVVTHRYLDPGALVQAGTSSSGAVPLLEISDNYLLRLDFPVSVDYVQDVHIGDEVRGQVESLGGKSFSGKIARAAMKVTDDTRTMVTEIEAPNPKLEITPGMYASVNFTVERHPRALAIPIAAVPPGQTSSVYVINSQNEIEERPVKLGMDTATSFEVLSGLKSGELVLLGSRSSVHPGEKVQPKPIDSLAAN